MKNFIIAIVCLAALLNSAGSASAQRQRNNNNNNFNNPRGITNPRGGTASSNTNYNVVQTGSARFIIPLNSRYGTNRFEEIEQNNIFDPSRRRPVEPPPPSIPSYSFAMNGGVTWENKWFAVLTGSGVSSRQDYTNGSTINGFNVSDITLKSIKLTGPSNEVFVLERGMRLTRTGTGPWQLAGQAEPTAESLLRNPSLGSSGEIDAGSVDVIAKMIARRAQQMGEAGGADDGAPGGEAAAPDNNASAPDMIPDPAPAPEDISSSPSGPVDDVTARLMARRRQESGGAAADAASSDSNSSDSNAQ